MAANSDNNITNNITATWLESQERRTTEIKRK